MESSHDHIIYPSDRIPAITSITHRLFLNSLLLTPNCLCFLATPKSNYPTTPLYPVIGQWAMSSQRFICGCRAQCKGLQKPVSLSTFNRHRKHRDAESFSTEFKGFLESSSAVPAPMGSQPEVTFYNNSSDSNLTELHMLWDAKIMDRNTIAEGNEVGRVGEDWEMEDSTEVRTWINI
jgi:hypothetical protein